MDYWSEWPFCIGYLIWSDFHVVPDSQQKVLELRYDQQPISLTEFSSVAPLLAHGHTRASYRRDVHRRFRPRGAVPGHNDGEKRRSWIFGELGRRAAYGCGRAIEEWKRLLYAGVLSLPQSGCPRH